MYMRDEKEERSKQDQTNNKPRQHNTPKTVTFPKKNELLRVGFEPTPLYTLDRTLYQLSCLGPGPNLTSHSAPGEQANYQYVRMSNIFSSPVDGFRQKKSGATGGGKFPHGGTAAGRGGTSSHLHPPPAPSHGANRKSEWWANIKQTLN